MRYFSVCSGIEAASVAWHPLGWEAVAFAEIEKFPAAVLKHHYPDVPNWGDMTKFQDWPDESVDLLVGGTPCQAFSVAGLRKGLADPRGNLTLTYLAVAAKYRPQWVVWENVPGVLSDGTGAFGAFLGGLGELGYGFAYRVLDAQHFGVPQRRRRVFVVGCAGDWRRAAAVLFERHSLQGNPAPSRETGQRTAASLVSGAKSSGGIGYDNQALFSQNGDNLIRLPQDELSRCLNAGGMGRQDWETETLVPMAFDTTQITSKANYSNPKAGDPCHPLASGAHPPAIAYDDRNQAASSDTHHTLRSDALGSRVSDAIVRAMQVRRLTPRECDRLQGFPDDYELVPYNGKPAKDGPRYKALGNSMAVPVMRWIGERIQQVDSIATTDRRNDGP